MKITLEFDGLDADEQEQFEIMQNARSFVSVIHEINQYMRAELKYKEPSEEREKAFEEIRDKLWELINEAGIGKHF